MCQMLSELSSANCHIISWLSQLNEYGYPRLFKMHHIEAYFYEIFLPPWLVSPYAEYPKNNTLYGPIIYS